ncbi:MAG: hypothetical protein IJ829_04860 [Kiritimatiellae bacterium]|nr:hypothetical protein [Kiritimatiellia bacterium]
MRHALLFSFLAFAVGTLRAADYFWQPVDGDWNGAWNDTAHWRSDAPGSSGYPSTLSDNASFIDCTLDNPVEVSLGDGTISAKNIRWFGTNASEVAFVGKGAASTTLQLGTISTASSADPIPSNSKVEFRDMTLSRPGWTIVKQVAGITNVTVRFDGVVETQSSFLQLSAPFSRLEFVDSVILTGGVESGRDEHCPAR